MNVLIYQRKNEIYLENIFANDIIKLLKEGGIIMDKKDYIKNRVDQQIEWYDTKSKKAKRKNTICKTIVIIIAALIPFVANFTSQNLIFKIAISSLGVVITITEGISNFNKFSELWIEYRTVCETLRHEKYMYLCQSGVYADGNFSYFVERIESIISQENLNWASLNKNEEHNKK